MPDITYRGAGSVATAASTSITVAEPTGTNDGDVLLAVIVDRKAEAANSAAPTGWTGVAWAQGGAYGRMQVFVGVKGQDGLTGSSWTFTGLATRVLAQIVGYYNVDTGTCLDVAASARFNNTGGTPEVTGTSGITTVTDGAMVVAVFGTPSAAPTWSGEVVATSPTLTERVDNAYGPLMSFAVADGIKSAAGSTGDSSATMSSSLFNQGILLALRPGGQPPLMMMMGIGT